jgi:[glutamine synthetase] adenylyltransferase / [glutamine synthetase]-adenylyl-L-tyrosine phosphorylase
LYEVDLRLRPSGNKGPVAVSLTSFISYQKTEAWTWEKLALTRARVVAGHPRLAEKLDKAIAAALQEPRDEKQIKKDVADMRALMLREQKIIGLWDIKRVRGGLVEVEFIAQYLQLIHASTQPAIISTNTQTCLKTAQHLNVLTGEQAGTLLKALTLYQRLTQLLRLCLSAQYEPATATKSLNDAVCRATSMPDMSATEALLAETQSRVSTVFDHLIGRS